MAEKSYANGYLDGLNDAWNIAYRLSMMTNEEKMRVFDVSPRDNIFGTYSADHVQRILSLKDEEHQHNGVTKEWLETYMYDHGIARPDLDYAVDGRLVLDLVNDILKEIGALGDVEAFKRKGAE